MAFSVLPEQRWPDQLLCALSHIMLNNDEATATSQFPGRDDSTRRSDAPHQIPLQIALTYLGFGLIWIWLTDRTLIWMNLHGEPGFWASAAKGTLFVVISAAFVYRLVHRSLESTLRTSALLRAVADGTSDAVFVKDRDGKYLLFNKAAAKLFGKSVAEVADKYDTDLFDPESARLLLERDQRVMNSGGAETEEEDLTVGGITRTFLATKAPYRDANGNVMGVIGISRDITDRKSAREATKRSERQFLALADAIPQIVWVAAPDGGLTYLNLKAAEYTGHQSDDLTGWSWERVIHPADLPQVVEQWIETLKLGIPRDQEFRIRRADGEYRWHITRQVPARSPDGQIAAWYGTCTDIEDLKRTQADLLKERTLLRTLIDSIPDVVFSKDAKGRFTLCNQGLIEFTGASSEAELLGKTVFEIFPASHAKSSHADDTRVIAHGETILNREEFTRDAAGRDSWRLVTKAPLRDQFGNIVGIVGISRDIQKRKEQDQLLEESRERLNLTLAAAQMGTWDLNVHSNQVIRSAECLSILGVHALAADNDSFLKIIHPDDVEKVSNAVRQSVSNTSGFTLEYRIIRPDGQVRWVYDIGKVHGSRSGSALRMIGVIQDITERKLVEDAVRRSQEMLRLILDNIPQGVFWKDRDSRYLGCNRVVAAAMKFESSESIVGLADADMPWITPEQAAFFTQKDRQVMDADEPAHHIVETMTLADGRTIWLETNKVPMHDEQGRVTGILGTWEDITGRKLAEQAIHDRERLLGIVTGSARVGLVVVSDHYEYLFANEAYAEIFGFEAQSIVGRRVSELLPVRWPQIQPLLDRALAGERVTYELTLPPRAGSPVPQWFRVMYEPHQGDLGAPTVVIVALDITDQKRTEAMIRASEERYRRLVDVLPGALFTHDCEQLVFCNPAFVRLMGADSAAELQRLSPFDVAHPDFRDIVGKRITEMQATRAAAPGIEMRIVRLDGKVVPVYSVSTMLPDTEHPTFLVALSDLTERERSMDLLHAVMGSVNDAILTIDSQGTVQLANPATERLFGYPLNQVVGENISILMPPQYQREHGNYVTDFIRTGETKVIGIGRELEGLRKDGTIFPLELNVTEFQMSSERHFTGVVRDITARKRLEAQFQQAQKMEAVGRLAGGIAHDFNNLLTIILGYSELILEDLVAEGRNQDWILLIRDAGERAGRLTQQLLAFSRKAIIEPQILNLNELIQESVNMFRRLIEENISVTVVADPALSPIKADPGQVEQVIMNLVVNARDAMPAGGRLTIQTKNVTLSRVDLSIYPTLKAGQYVSVTVSDTGTGITSDLRDKIFEPFFTTKEVGKGTGLGLAVVHGVIEQCEGYVGVESVVGVGTTFKLLFPSATELAPGSESGMVKRSTRGSETILLVEDEDEVRTIARLALETQGFNVLVAPNGTAALQLAEEIAGPIDLLVTDVVMPGMGGRILAESMRLRSPGIRVLYMSGYMDDAIVQNGIVHATDAFIQKPFTPVGLARKARAVLDGDSREV